MLQRLTNSVLYAAVLLTASALIAEAYGQTDQPQYPTKTVKLVVTYPPGGTSDLVARPLANALSARLKQSFIVENRAGAGGQIGTDYVAKAAPDGYTLLVAASGPISYLPALSPSLPYDVRKDFAPVANIVTVPNLMIVSASSPIKSLQDLAAVAKANPGKVYFGSAGVGSSGHISGELFNLLAGVKMVHIPYRGSGPAMVDLIAGQTTVMFENLPSALTQVRGGKLRGIAVLSRRRSPSAPEFPSTTELGMPDLEIASSTGILAPAGTPAEVIGLLEKTLRDIANDADMAKTFGSYGADVDFMDAAQYRSYMEREIQRWTMVGQKANIKVK